MNNQIQFTPALKGAVASAKSLMGFNGSIPFLRWPLVLIFFLPLGPGFLFSQSIQVQNAYMYLKEKQFDKAKLNVDAAAEADKTKSLAKVWMYRGQIYQGIFQDTSKKVNDLDPDAAEKAVASYVRCLQLDKDNIYKDQVKEGLRISAGVLKKIVEKYYIPSKQYDKAAAACEVLKTALPYDFDEMLKRQNITPENLMYLQYQTYYSLNDQNKAKELGNKLMEINFKIPLIYSSMAKLSLGQQDTVTALSYLDKGLALFEDNLDLVTMQIDILLAQKKIDVLKQKMENAIEISPDNDVLHAALANLCEKTGDMEKAEKEYLKAIELKPKNEVALFNLGAFYFNAGSEWSKKSNALPPKETAKAKEYEAKSDDYSKKAIVYFEKYYQLKPDAAVKQRLRLLHNRLGETEKAEKYK